MVGRDASRLQRECTPPPPPCTYNIVYDRICTCTIHIIHTTRTVKYLGSSCLHTPIHTSLRLKLYPPVDCVCMSISGYVPTQRDGGAYPAHPGPVPQGLPTRALLQLRHLQLGGGAHTHPFCTSSHTCSLNLYIKEDMHNYTYMCVPTYIDESSIACAPCSHPPIPPPRSGKPLPPPPRPPSDPLAYLQHRRRGR